MGSRLVRLTLGRYYQPETCESSPSSLRRRHLRIRGWNRFAMNSAMRST